MASRARDGAISRLVCPVDTGIVVRLILWTLLSFGAAAFVVVKAVTAMRRGQRYRFTRFDGGVFHGKEVSPRVMLGVAGIYVVGVGALLALPLGLYQWLDDATSECRGVVTVDDVNRLTGRGVKHVDVQELKASCSLSMTGDDERRLIDLRIDGAQRFASAPSTRELAVENGVRIRRDDERSTTTLWLNGAKSGSMKMTLSRESFDERAVSELASKMASSRAIQERYASAWQRPSNPFARTFRRYGFALLPFGVIAAIVAAFVVADVRRKRAIRKALDE